MREKSGGEGGVLEERERSGREKSGGRWGSGVRKGSGGREGRGGRKESCGREGQSCGAQTSTYFLHDRTILKFKFKKSKDI